MPRGGARPGSGRKPGFGAIDKLNTAAREQARELLGSADDPLQLALAYAKDPDWPPAIRAQLVLGLISVTYPKLVAQTIQSTNLQVHMSGDVLAAKTALALELRSGVVATLEGETSEANDVRELADLIAEASE